MQEAAQYHRDAIALTKSPTGCIPEAIAYAEAALWALMCGELAQADDYLNQGLATTSSAFRYLARPQLLLCSAFVALQRGDTATATTWVEEAEEYVRESAMQHMYPAVSWVHGRVCQASGDLDSALTNFARATDLGLGLGMRPVVWQARASEADVLASLGRGDDARAKRDEARATIDEIAGLFSDEDMRAAFLGGAERTLANAPA